MTSTGVVEGSLSSHAFFASGHLALDFLNSRPMPVEAWVDDLCDGVGLVHWLEHAGAIEGANGRRIRDGVGASAALDEVAGRARALREWLRGFVGRHAGREVGEKALAELRPLNDLLERGSSYWQIEMDGDGGAMSTGELSPRLRKVQRLAAPDQLLQPVAEAIADLIGNEDFRLVRFCEGDACGRVFLARAGTRGAPGHGRTLCGGCLRASCVNLQHVNNNCL